MVEMNAVSGRGKAWLRGGSRDMGHISENSCSLRSPLEPQARGPGSEGIRICICPAWGGCWQGWFGWLPEWGLECSVLST